MERRNNSAERLRSRYYDFRVIIAIARVF